MKAIAWLARVAAAFGVSFYSAYVIVRLWQWFVVPQFGIHSLGFWNACGFSLMVGVYHLTWLMWLA